MRMESLYYIMEIFKNKRNIQLINYIYNAQKLH